MDMNVIFEQIVKDYSLFEDNPFCNEEPEEKIQYEGAELLNEGE